MLPEPQSAHMKKTPMMLALAITLGAATSALAADKTQDKQKKDKPANSQTAASSQTPAKAQVAPNTAAQKENTALTGSYIKREVKRNGVVTDGPNPVYVLDHDAVQTSGASDLSQVLLRKGFRR
jgi:hypothetical protein